MFKVACVVAYLYMGTDASNYQFIPPIVRGEVVAEKMAGSRELLMVEFKDLRNKTKVMYFEANTCKYEEE